MAFKIVHLQTIPPISASGWSEGTRESVSIADGVMKRSAAAATSQPAPIAAWRDYLALTKPRIVTMILVTTVCTGVIGAGGRFDIAAMVWLLLGTGLVAAAAGSANQILERHLDCAMPRTASRPLPAGRIETGSAIAFSAALLFAGIAILGFHFSWIPAAFGGATWLSYIVLYTPLKTRTTFNTTVGAVAGALPVMIGYTALGGSIGGVAGWLLFAVLAAWQYPHFMAIAWMYRKQYSDAGFKMTPSVYPDGRSAATQAIVGSIVLMISALALVAVVTGFESSLSISYIAIGSIAIVAVVLPMLLASIQFAKDRNDQTARRLLRSSLLVLPLVLLTATIGVAF